METPTQQGNGINTVNNKLKGLCHQIEEKNKIKEEEKQRLSGTITDITDIDKKKLRYYLGRHKCEEATKEDYRILAFIANDLRSNMHYSKEGQRYANRYMQKHLDSTIKEYEYPVFADLILSEFETFLFKNKE